MVIEINENLILTVFEKCLIVKDGKLFNTNTNEFEAIEGDKVRFCFVNDCGIDCWICGTVDGYTCNRRIQLKGVRELYATKQGSKKTIEHLSKITDSDYDDEDDEYEAVNAYDAMMKAEWEAALSE